MRLQRAIEVLAAREAEPARDERARFGRLGNDVRLESVLHLQPVLERAQEVVGVGELRAFLFGDEGAVGEPAQAHERVRHAQPVVAATVGQLQRLRDKFDLTDAAAAELDVVTALLFSLAIDLLFREPDAGERV